MEFSSSTKIQQSRNRCSWASTRRRSGRSDSMLASPPWTCGPGFGETRWMVVMKFAEAALFCVAVSPSGKIRDGIRQGRADARFVRGVLLGTQSRNVQTWSPLAKEKERPSEDADGRRSAKALRSQSSSSPSCHPSSSCSRHRE